MNDASRILQINGNKPDNDGLLYDNHGLLYDNPENWRPKAMNVFDQVMAVVGPLGIRHPDKGEGFATFSDGTAVNDDSGFVSGQGQPMARIYVRWLDSHYRTGWTDAEPVGQCAVIETIGFLLAESDDALVLSSHISFVPNHQHCGDMTIPKRSVIEYSVLKVARYGGSSFPVDNAKSGE